MVCSYQSLRWAFSPRPSPLSWQHRQRRPSSSQSGPTLSFRHHLEVTFFQVLDHILVAVVASKQESGPWIVVIRPRVYVKVVSLGGLSSRLKIFNFCECKDILQATSFVVGGTTLFILSASTSRKQNKLTAGQMAGNRSRSSHRPSRSLYCLIMVVWMRPSVPGLVYSFGQAESPKCLAECSMKDRAPRARMPPPTINEWSSMEKGLWWAWRLRALGHGELMS